MDSGFWACFVYQFGLADQFISGFNHGIVGLPVVIVQRVNRFVRSTMVFVQASNATGEDSWCCAERAQRAGRDQPSFAAECRPRSSHAIPYRVTPSALRETHEWTSSEIAVA